MRLSKTIFTFSILVLGSGALSAADYYVAPNGGSGAGTKANPWSLNYANAQLQPGDKAILRGGTYKNVVIAPTRSGTSGSKRIIYQAFPNETPEFRASKIMPAPISIENRSYITVDGISADGEGIYLDSNYDHWVLFSKTHHSIVKNSKFIRSQGWGAVNFENGSKYNKLLNNTFDTNGTWDKFAWKGIHQDTGGMINIKPGNRYNLIEGNVIRRSGHDLGKIEGEYNILRYNTFDNSWGIYSGPAFKFRTGDIQPGDEVGNRSLSIAGGSNNLVEYNIFKNVPESADNSTVGMMKIGGSYQIMRRNVFTNGSGFGFTSNVGDATPKINNNMIYNNTFTKIDGPIWKIHSYGSQYPKPANNVFKNNIVYRAHQSSDMTDVDIIFSNLKASYGDPFVNTLVANNCIAYNASASNQKVKSESGGIKALSWYESNYSQNFYKNVQKNPQFRSDVNNPTSLEDMALKENSPCIDAGGNLTRTTASGSGNVIAVDNAAYFSDGYGVIPGDLVKIGTNKVQITKVDIPNKRITVNKSISWSSGAPVNLEFTGNKPDIGAVEFQGTALTKSPISPPAAPTLLQ